MDERGVAGGPCGRPPFELRGQEPGGTAYCRPKYGDADTASLPILESVPAVSAKLKSPVTADRKFEDVVKSAQDAAVLVLVY